MERGEVALNTALGGHESVLWGCAQFGTTLLRLAKVM